MSAHKSMSKQLARQKSKAIMADIKQIKLMLDSFAYEEIVTDEIKHTIAERRLERIINRAIDINFHLIRALGSPPPDDYTQSFLQLATLKIIDAKLARAIAPAAAARNILIHGYDELDAKKFYSSLQDAVKLFPKYIRAIDDFVEKEGK